MKNVEADFKRAPSATEFDIGRFENFGERKMRIPAIDVNVRFENLQRSGTPPIVVIGGKFVNLLQSGTSTTAVFGSKFENVYSNTTPF